MANILVIDDDPMICSMLSRMGTGMGHDVSNAVTLKDGIGKACSQAFDLVFLDVRLPDGNGLEALQAIRETRSLPEVIIMTGAGEPDGAELAIRSGAWDYIEKPSSLQDMTLPFVRALQYREEKRARSRDLNIVSLKREGIVGDSPQMIECLDLVARVAGTDAGVLITGETGTGKELFAVAVHRNSRRANKPLIVVDCSTLPETLVEGMLFGHHRGAFTGADKAKVGLIKQADGGTLFLDEVGELPLNVQKAFLRVLQERRFRPLGGKAEVESDFRLVTATNRDLQKMVEAGQFREDLFFRLKSFTINLPPLRDRQGGIRELTIHHMGKICERYGIGLKGYSADFMEALTSYPWPGNVRELFHAVERAMAAAQFEANLFARHLPDEIRIHFTKTALSGRPSGRSVEDCEYARLGKLSPFKRFKHEMESRYLRELMTVSGGYIKEACRISGLSRSYLYELLKHYEIMAPRGQAPPGSE